MEEVEAEEVEVVEEAEEAEVEEDGMVEILVTDITDPRFINITLVMFLGGQPLIGLPMIVKMDVQRLAMIHGGVNIQVMVQMIVYLLMIVMVVDSSVVVYTYNYKCCK